jgi:hypothetical protein
MSLRKAWWHKPKIPVPRRLTQEDHEFKASLGYYLKQKKEEEEM